MHARGVQGIKDSRDAPFSMNVHAMATVLGIENYDRSVLRFEWGCLALTGLIIGFLINSLKYSCMLKTFEDNFAYPSLLYQNHNHNESFGVLQHNDLSLK